MKKSKIKMILTAPVIGVIAIFSKDEGKYLMLMIGNRDIPYTCIAKKGSVNYKKIRMIKDGQITIEHSGIELISREIEDPNSEIPSYKTYHSLNINKGWKFVEDGE